VAESYTIRSSRFTWPVRKFLYILSYYGNYTDLIQEFFCVDRREAYKPQLRFELITFWIWNILTVPSFVRLPPSNGDWET